MSYVAYTSGSGQERPRRTGSRRIGKLPEGAAPVDTNGRPLHVDWVVKADVERRFYCDPTSPMYDTFSADCYFPDIDAAARAAFLPADVGFWLQRESPGQDDLVRAQRILGLDGTREEAARAGDLARAHDLLLKIAPELDAMLDEVERAVVRTASPRGGTVRDRATDSLTIRLFNQLPSSELADLFGLPPVAILEAFGSLGDRLEVTDQDRQVVVGELVRLRTQIADAVADRDHTRFGALVRRVLAIFLPVCIAASAAALGALVISEPVIQNVLKDVVILVVSKILYEGFEKADVFLRRSGERAWSSRYHKDELLNCLEELRSEIREPAYDGAAHQRELNVWRMRILVRVHAAHLSALEVSWRRRQEYWRALSACGAFATSTDLAAGGVVLEWLIDRLESIDPGVD